MRYFLSALLLSATALSPAAAKPRLNNSEMTYQLACLDETRSYEDKVDLCTAALEDARLSESDRQRLLLALGDAQTVMQDFGSAHESFAKVLARKPDSAAAHAGIGWIYYNDDAFGDAVEKFRQAIALEGSSSNYAGLGGALYRQSTELIEEALEALDTATLLEPGYDWAWAEMGWILHSAGRSDEALDAFKEALKISPNYVFVLHNMAVAQNNAGQHAAALETANHLLSLEDNYWMLLERARALRELGRNMQALRDASAAIDQDPTPEDGYVSKAFSLEAMGLNGAAVEVYSSMPADVARTDYSYYYEALLLQDDGQATAALAAAERAIALDIGDYTNWELKARILIAQEDYFAALSAARQANTLLAESEWALLYQAIALTHLGQSEEAMELYRQAHDLGLPPGATNWFVEHLVAMKLTKEAKEVRKIARSE